MSDFFGISNNNSNIFNTFFGSSSSTNTSSGMTGLSDLKMIQSGAYKKALKAYYATQQDDDEINNSISNSGKADSDNSLSLVKSTAQTLNKAAGDLRDTDFDTASDDDLKSKVKAFVDGYNSTLTSTKNMNSYSILQTELWATKQVGVNAGLLNDVGISIDENNKLTLDEEKLKKADKGTLKSLFSGSGSLAAQIAQKSASLVNLSTNQLAVNSGKSTYTSSGTLR